MTSIYHPTWYTRYVHFSNSQDTLTPLGAKWYPKSSGMTAACSAFVRPPWMMNDPSLLEWDGTPPTAAWLLHLISVVFVLNFQGWSYDWEPSGPQPAWRYQESSRYSIAVIVQALFQGYRELWIWSIYFKVFVFGFVRACQSWLKPFSEVGTSAVSAACLNLSTCRTCSVQVHVPSWMAPLRGLSSHVNLNLTVNLCQQYGVPPCVLLFLKSFVSFADDPLMPVDTFLLPCLWQWSRFCRSCNWCCGRSLEAANNGDLRPRRCLDQPKLQTFAHTARWQTDDTKTIHELFCKYHFICLLWSIIPEMTIRWYQDHLICTFSPCHSFIFFPYEFLG